MLYFQPLYLLCAHFSTIVFLNTSPFLESVSDSPSPPSFHNCTFSASRYSISTFLYFVFVVVVIVDDNNSSSKFCFFLVSFISCVSGGFGGGGGGSNVGSGNPNSTNFTYTFHGDPRATFAEFFGTNNPFESFFSGTTGLLIFKARSDGLRKSQKGSPIFYACKKCRELENSLSHCIHSKLLRNFLKDKFS